MYYADKPRDKWTALDVLEEECDPTPPEVYCFREEIKQWMVQLEQWDILHEIMLLDDKTVEKKKDFIKWKIRSLEHKIALYICAFTHPVREGNWDQPTIRIGRLHKTGFI